MRAGIRSIMPGTGQLALDLEVPRTRRAQSDRSFHVRLPGARWAEVEAGEVRARGQDELVLQAFRECPGAHYTPSQVHAAMLRAGHRLLLTSVRRSLTNLTHAGLLVHHRDERRVGPFGAKETCWGLAT